MQKSTGPKTDPCGARKAKMGKVNYQYKRWTMKRKQELMYNNNNKRAQTNRHCCPER